MEILNLLKGWDKDLFLLLNGLHSPLMDYSMTLFTLTSTWLIFYGVILVSIILKYDKKSLFVIVALILLVLCSDQLAGLLKHTTERLRPSNDPSLKGLAHVFYSGGGLYGFVSAHAANTFAFATFTTLLFSNLRFTTFIFPWAFLIAYSRIYLGVHYPGDILGGAILGVGVGILVFKLMLLSEHKLSRINLFVRNPLNDKEANRFLITGIFTMLAVIGIVQILLKNNLINIK